ncbi:hypothetical protein DA076_10965 [Lactiplantibacillus plantarum]|uniref:ECF transporter S component n=1 Tax=Lactiplantibacillus plantarum TaxID=1590 RepID=UPI000D21A6EF|nr:ECF transporter S component [Lactiplantibacillus plantarum]AVW08216.1 hypothetical protein DA076_10965 [Lactiplantibacillus plantarum]
MGRSEQLKKLVLAGLFAAIIFIGISVLRIPLPAIVGRPFIHFGNILTVLAVMLLGFGYGATVGAVGLGLFDILNGYAATSWCTGVIEALMVGTTLKVAMIGSFTSLLAATINAVACVIIVPLLYRILVQVGFNRQRVGTV